MVNSTPFHCLTIRLPFTYLLGPVPNLHLNHNRSNFSLEHPTPSRNTLLYRRVNNAQHSQGALRYQGPAP